MEAEQNILCCGCLCFGRKMVVLEDYWKKQCFLQILTPKPTSASSSDICLCWECNALIARFTAFKRQVRSCHKLLNDYLEKNLNTSQIHRTPRLKTHRVLDLSLHPDSDVCNETVDVDRVKTESEEVRYTEERGVSAYSGDLENEQTLIEYKEEDDVSAYSDNLDDDQVLIQYKSKKKKKKVKKKRKKKQPEEEAIEEVELTAEDLAEERRQQQQKEEYVNAMFRCEKCVVSFPNADDLEDHVRMKHDANKSRFVCSVCECSFRSEMSHNYHVSKHRRRYRCTACGDAFPSKRAAKNHYDVNHSTLLEMEYDLNETVQENGKTEEAQESNNRPKQESAIFPCEFCEKTFRWKTSLRKHVETHRIETGQKRKPYCEPCRLTFTTTANLQKHVKTSSKHQIQLKLRKLTESLPDNGSPEKKQACLDQIKQSVNSSRQQYPCPQCDKRFQWRGNLSRHLHSHKARAAGSLVCSPCNRTFSSIATYRQHMSVSRKHVSEEDFKYMCSECGKRFANKTRLKDHVDWEHLKNFIHTCDLCQKVFKSHTSLYLHKQVVHKKANAEHLCDHCGKHFPNHAKLRCHIVALHSSTAPYKCSKCTAKFSWHSCLSRHARRVHKPKDITPQE